MRTSTAQAPAVARDFFAGTDLAENVISASAYRDLHQASRLVQGESAQGLEQNSRASPDYSAQRLVAGQAAHC